jgi:hypothetical protein
MILADIITVVLNEGQLNELRKLKNLSDEKYLFASRKLILSKGVDPDNNQYKSIISDHSKKILPIVE